jgi:hypothetical protein
VLVSFWACLTFGLGWPDADLSLCQNNLMGLNSEMAGLMLYNYILVRTGLTLCYAD